LSSTILYLAIVAIWAGVLVPRWLRHEPQREAVGRLRRVGAATNVHVAGEAVYAAARGAVGARAVPAADPGEEGLLPRRGTGENAGWQPGTRSPGRARAIAARRRVFGVLVVLAGAAATIAASGLATWWVVVPPAGLLAGCVALLREAARADAELRRRRGAVVRADAGVQRRTRAGEVSGPAGALGGNVDGAVGRPVGAVVGRPVGAVVGRPVGAVVGRPVGAVVGRPGGAVDADMSDTADVVDITARLDEEAYDQYADAKLRAVGD